MRIHRLTGSVAMSLGLNSTPTCQFKSAAHRRKAERWPAIGGSVDAIRVRLAPSVEQSIKPLQTSQPRQQTFTAARAEAPKFPCSHVYLFPCSQLVPPIWGAPCVDAAHHLSSIQMSSCRHANANLLAGSRFYVSGSN